MSRHHKIDNYRYASGVNNRKHNDFSPSKLTEIYFYDDVSGRVFGKPIFGVQIYGELAYLLLKQKLSKKDLEELKACIAVVSQLTDAMNNCLDKNTVKPLKKHLKALEPNRFIVGEIFNTKGRVNKKRVKKIALFTKELLKFMKEHLSEQQK